MTTMLTNLRLGVSGLAIVTGSLVAPAALAQQGPPAPAAAATTQSTESIPPGNGTGATPQTQVATPAIGSQNTVAESANDIVVTGTSIRGTVPVGQNLISVGQAQIQATPSSTMQQVLKSIPQITGSTTIAQGGFQSNDASSSYAPTIHGLGGSASSTTLILVDSHRIALDGVSHALADPNIVPPIALERVEVLADGASATYGSDAIAGVINFITRRRYDGIEANGQLGFGHDYKTYSAGLIAGKSWDTGSAFFAYNYSNRGHLRRGDRPFTAADQRANGGQNFAGFSCSPASIGIGSNIYAYPYTAAPINNAGANAFCDFSGLGDLFPQEVRNNGMIKVIQEVGDNLTVQVDAVYSFRDTNSNNGRGSVDATVFGPGSGKGGQINPFFVPVPGSTATSYTVRFDANELFGPGATSNAYAEDFYVHTNLDYKLSDKWRLEFNGIVGVDNAGNSSQGGLNSSVARLALNGTTNSGGSLTDLSVPATGLIVTQVPLTTANALDVFNPRATNRTSAAVRALLLDSGSSAVSRQTLINGRLQASGSLFSLPGGDVRVAAGVEYSAYTAEATLTGSLNIGANSTGSSRRQFSYLDRNVKSAYGELLIPIISPEMGIPAVRSFTVNLAGRIDKYNDFGSTKNPKIAANWEVFEGLKLRGNWARSFVAPQVQAVGIAPLGLAGETGYGRSNGGDAQVTLPFSLYPDVKLLPGCISQIAANPAITGCRLAQSGTLEGVEYRTGTQLNPQKGRTWSIGGDFTPDFARGLRLSATWWHSRVKGGITAPAQSLTSGASLGQQLYTFYPNGATAAQLGQFINGIPQTSSLPAVISYIYNRSYRNVLNIYVAGLDIEGSYSLNTSVGRFTIGNALSYLTKFKQNFGNDPKFSILNSSGFNLTFPSIQVTGRANVGWEYEGISFDAFMNYVGKYHNLSTSSLSPITRNAQGNPTGGGDIVKGIKTFDLHAAYTVPNFLKKAQIYVDVQNLFDKKPPFFNGSTGYDMFSANPLLRVISVGLRTSF